MQISGSDNAIFILDSVAIRGEGVGEQKPESIKTAELKKREMHQNPKLASNKVVTICQCKHEHLAQESSNL